MGPSSTDPRIGQIFADRYRVERFLGRGGMGVVYAASRLDDQRPVALKLIHPELSENTLVVERFRRELRLSAQLFSPFVVEVLDMGRSAGGELFMVMELLDGQPLSHLLARQGALRAGRVVRIGSQVAQGLAAAHELGIVHRDLKPDNIFVFDREARGGRPGERDRAKILDFGVARFLRTEQPVPVAGEDEWQTLTRQGSIVGTPRYMSPEAIVGDDATPESDLYALGVVLYEMIAGSPPFPCENRQKAIDQHLLTDVEPLRVRAPGCAPPALERLILKLLAKEPGDRPSSASEVAAQLVDALEMTEPDLFEELGAALTTSERSINHLAAAGAKWIPEGSAGQTLIPEGSAGHTLIPEGASGYTRIPEGSAGHTLIPEGSSGHTLIPEGSAGHTLIPEGYSGHTLIPDAAGEDPPGWSAPSGAPREVRHPERPSARTLIPLNEARSQDAVGQNLADAADSLSSEREASADATTGVHPCGRADHTVVPEMYDAPDRAGYNALMDDLDAEQDDRPHEPWSPGLSLDEVADALPPLRELGDPSVTDEATEVISERFAELEDEPMPTELVDGERAAALLEEQAGPPSVEAAVPFELRDTEKAAPVTLPTQGSQGKRWELPLVAAGALSCLALLWWWLA